MDVVVVAAAGAGVAGHAATAESRGAAPLVERALKPSRVAVVLAPPLFAWLAPCG